MPRRVRVFVAGNIYHIYCRVARGEFIFDEPGEVDRWIQLVAYVARLFDLRILAWCLLSNHYHMVVQTGSLPLFGAMARLQGRYSKGYNRDRRFNGRVWQSRYKARLVLDAEYLWHVIAYVHLNPVSARMVDDPLHHPASGHAELLGLRAPALCDVGAALLCYDAEPRITRKLYQEWLRVVAEQLWFRAGVWELPWWRTVDEDDETLALQDAPEDAADFEGQSLPEEEARRPTLATVLEVFEAEMGVPAEHLAGAGRPRTLPWCRRIFATLTVSWLGYPVKDVPSERHPDRCAAGSARGSNCSCRSQASGPGWNG